ncbi:MAG TPA: DUF4932 domain-containing protein [Gemmatimonadales bacterium]|jgi:hypothetical protein
MSRRFVTAALLGVALASRGSAQTPHVAVDTRTELLGLIFKLAGAAEYNQGRLPAYDADIQRQFGLFKNHPGVTAARAAHDNDGLSGDVAATLAVNLSDAPMLLERQPFDARPGESRWRTQSASRFLIEVRRFAVETRATGFLAQHQRLYDTAAARVRRTLDRNADFGWFGRFFGGPAEQDFTVVPLLTASGVTYTPTADVPRHRTERFVMVGYDQADSSGYPVFNDQLADVVVREYTHAFVNPLVDQFSTQLEGPAGTTYAAVADPLREQGYGGWVSLSFETMARAAIARYYAARMAAGRDSATARAYLADQRARGWVWVDDLSALFAAYETDRTTYPTLRAFMPRVVQFFDSLPARLPAMQQRYDATRPHVASVSIPAGAMDVDPALREIAITFDRPMKPGSFGVNAVPGSRDKMVRIQQQQFDSTGTVLRLAVSLEPGHDYTFTLNRYTGGGFISAGDGVPLARTPVQFRTRPAKTEPGQR